VKREGRLKMSKISFIRGIALMAILGVVSLYGCGVPGKVTGGGFIENCDGSKSNFGFNASSCEGYIKGHFNYIDKNAGDYLGGVKMNGTVIDAAECVDPDICKTKIECVYCKMLMKKYNEYDSERVYQVTVNYRSTNPKFPGEGEAIACVVDNGEGINASASDLAAIKVTSGPFEGYFNAGPVQGNIQAHDCDY